jgi:hypothetical protein
MSMSKTRKDPALGDHPDSLAIIHCAMRSAARKARAENDRLGIPTPDNVGGKVVWKHPVGKRRRPLKPSAATPESSTDD